MTEEAAPRTGPSRRGLLVGGLGFAGAYACLRIGLPALSERLGTLAFEPLDRPAGFRRLVSEGGVSTTGFDPFVGIGAGAAPAVTPSCAGLFDGDAAPGLVPVAYFSDYNCAWCRVMSPRLAALPGAAVTLHELPLLGEGSIAMARAALAADLQGAHAPFHAALMRTPRLSPDAVARIAADLGLDAARLRTDMDGPAVDAALARSRASAATFGFYATPSMVVGRTAVVGALGEGHPRPPPGPRARRRAGPRLRLSLSLRGRRRRPPPSRPVSTARR